MTEDTSRGRRNRRRAWVPEMLAGRYEIGSELGVGAAAVTVAAHDRRLDRRVAIKILKPESERDSEFSRRFTREARAAAAINHPNVVSVYDVGQEGDLLYLVMQYVDGTDLKRHIERNGALPWRRSVEIARDVLAGLAPIHEAGIVHRDIKPQNVLIGKDGSVKVTDFGVAHMELDAALTTAGTTVGTASYMAPEQAQGQNPTPAADVYAVGVMLYEMVTGRLPFEEPTSIATMLAHIQQEAGPPVAPAGTEPVPEGLVLVIQQAMAKSPTSRFRTAMAMRRALEDPDTLAGAAGGGTAVGPTEVVPSVRHAAPRPRTPAAAPVRAATPPHAPARGERDGGFGLTFVVVLLGLALMLAAVAGTLWLMEDRPNLLAGGGADDPTSTAVMTTPTPTLASEAPAVIEPVEQEPEPTSTPAPEPTPTPLPPTPTPEPPTPTPTEQIIVPVDPTEAPAPDQSTGGEEPQIIEPIQTVEPQN